MPQLNEDTYQGHIERLLLEAIADYAEYMIEEWRVDNAPSNDPLHALVDALRAIRSEYNGANQGGNE
jgi:hypothetical protein